MNPEPPEHEPRGFSGKKVLLISLVACIAIPLVAFYIPVLLIESNKTPEAALDWAQRGTWEIVPTRPRVLRWGDTPRPPFEGREVDELPFAITEQEATEVMAWSDAADTPHDGSAEPTGFYTHYLSGRRAAEAGQDDAAQRHFEQAFAAAPQVLVWRFTDPDGEPFANRRVGTIELVMMRMRDGELDDTLRLRYPRLETDARGRVWLPVYATVYSLGDGTRWAEGIQVDHGLTPWFESPGKVGSLPDAVVHRGDEPGSR